MKNRKDKKEKPWIKLFSPSLDNMELEMVADVLRSGWWGLGPVTEQFEKEFAKFVGAKYAVSVNSCTAALHLALRILKKKSLGGKIIVPAFTFLSSAVIGLYEGCRVEFSDIDEKTFCLDPSDVKKRIDKDTIAVITVHYGGRLADTSYDSNVPIIEDCAHAVGTKGAGRKGIMACWSFHPVKNIATGDGGMITTDDRNLAEKLKRLRWLGINLSTYDREKRGYSWEYNVKEIGYKYHSNDIMSAIGLSQLRRIKALNEKRKIIAERYMKELKKLPLILPAESGSWHLFVIRVEKKFRNKLVDFFRKNKISPGVHYKPLYYYPIFGLNPNKAKKELPITEKIWQEVISLPIHPDLTENEQKKVIDTLRKFFS